MERVPCRVSVDLRQHQAAADKAEAARRTPDFAQHEDLRDVVPAEMVAPIARLFASRNEVLTAQRINWLDKSRGLERLMTDLAALERALYVRWNEQ